jgi:nucleoside-diphosphate-sugar epimerase
MPTNDNAILITGATGFLGRLIVSEALARTDAPLVLPLRDLNTKEAVVSSLFDDATANGRLFGARERNRLHFVELPPPDQMTKLLPTLERHGVTDVLHCAGCLSYFNVRKLQAGNLDLTRALLSVAEHLDLRRFVYLSTAYSSGFRRDSIPERIHESGVDPTAYTRSKRQTEQLVAQSNVPWVIVRPSIVVGDSRDGRYGGKPYGVYQLWSGYQRFLQGSYPEVLHIVAADAPINFIHQDAFVAGFWAAYEKLAEGSIIHVASREARLPTMRQLVRMWLDHYGGPREVHLYDRLSDVPFGEVDESERLWLEFTSVNSEIASVRWDFELHQLTALRETGIELVDASLDTLEICQERFVLDSPKVARFIDEYRRRGSRRPRVVMGASSRSPREVSDAAE